MLNHCDTLQKCRCTHSTHFYCLKLYSITVVLYLPTLIKKERLTSAYIVGIFRIYIVKKNGINDIMVGIEWFLSCNGRQ